MGGFRRLRLKNAELRELVKVMDEDMGAIADMHVDAADRALAYQDALEPAYREWRKAHPHSADPNPAALVAWLVDRK